MMFDIQNSAEALSEAPQARQKVASGKRSVATGGPSSRLLAPRKGRSESTK